MQNSGAASCACVNPNLVPTSRTLVPTPAATALPTLVVSGERSPAAFRHMADVVAHCAVMGESVMIPRAMHPMIFDNPQAFNEAVLNFVAKH